jgi:hypothetical protein
MSVIIALRDQIHSHKNECSLSEQVRKLFENDHHQEIKGCQTQLRGGEVRITEHLCAVYSYVPLFVKEREEWAKVQYHSQFPQARDYVMVLSPGTAFSLRDNCDVTTVVYEVKINLTGFGGLKRLFQCAYYERRTLYDLVWNLLLEVEEAVRDEFVCFAPGEAYEDTELYALLNASCTTTRERGWSVEYTDVIGEKKYSGVLSSAQLLIPEGRDVIITPLFSYQELLARRRECIRTRGLELWSRYAEFLKTERKLDLEKITEKEFYVLVQPRAVPNPVDMAARDYKIYQQLSEKYTVTYLPCVVVPPCFQELPGTESGFSEQTKMFRVGNLNKYVEERLMGVLVCTRK